MRPRGNEAGLLRFWGVSVARTASTSGACRCVLSVDIRVVLVTPERQGCAPSLCFQCVRNMRSLTKSEREAFDNATKAIQKRAGGTRESSRRTLLTSGGDLGQGEPLPAGQHRSLASAMARSVGLRLFHASSDLFQWNQDFLTDLGPATGQEETAA